MAEENETVTPDPKPDTKPSTEQVSEDTKPTESNEDSTGEIKSSDSEVVPQWRFNKEYGKNKALERENEELKAKLNQNQQPAVEKAPNWNEYEAQGKSIEEFNSDWVDYKVEKRLKAKEEKDAANNQQLAWQERTRKAALNAQVKSQSARAQHRDFDAAVENANSIGIGFLPAVNLLIDEDDNAGELRYHLSTNHDDAYKLMQLPVDKAILQLGRISTKLSKGKGQPGKMTNASNPPTPLEGGNKAPTEFRNDMTKSEYFQLYKPL